MLYFGEPLDAETVLAHGLVNAVVPTGAVLHEAQQWASRLAGLPPLALRSAKLLVHGAALHGLGNGIEAERQAVAYLFQTGDAREGIGAFLEKRAAKFQGN
jgi:enoyl-CoA hydratase/carnithine racemase